jgi:NADH dehydrogenase FAD-containing subunit
MRKHLVLVGGGHAHMMVLESIHQFVAKNVKVTVIGPSGHHYYSGMGPGMLGGTYQPEEIRFQTQKVVQHQGGIFVKDRVTRIDAEKKKVFTASDHAFSYDLISFNAGSFVPMDMLNSEKEKIQNSDTVYSVKPIERLMAAAGKLKQLFKEKKIHVSVVGGGPSSAEVAGNVWQLAKQTNANMPEITIFSGKKLMGRFPESVRMRMVRLLEKKNIHIDETGYAKAINPGRVLLESGREVKTDFIFMAMGVRPSLIFQSSGLPVGDDGGLLVNSYLQSVGYPEIFGGGDCICFQHQPLDKVGVYAVRQNPVLLNNLLAFLDEQPLQPFDPGPDYLLIFNAGGGVGVLKKHGLVFGGRIAFWIKDYIDRKFMKKFQAIEKNL